MGGQLALEICGQKRCILERTLYAQYHPFAEFSCVTCPVRLQGGQTLEYTHTKQAV